MKILIFKGSPNIHGSSAMLADALADGAVKAGHEVISVNVSQANIHPCLGCLHCGYDGPCIQKDGMQSLRHEILASDMLVFATPLYYYGFSAQLKTLIDRFCAFNFEIESRHLRSALLVSACNSADWTFDAIKAHYQTLVRYLGFKDEGMVLGAGCGTPEMTKSSKYPDLAYKLGASLK